MKYLCKPLAAGFLSFAILFSSVSSGVAQTFPYECQGGSQSQNCDSSEKGGWLILMLVSTLKDAMQSSVRQQAGPMFDSWFGWLFGKAKIPPDNKPVGNSMTQETAVQQGSMQPVGMSSSAAFTPPATPVTATQQNMAVKQAIDSPALAVSVQFLVGPEANAAPHPLLGTSDFRLEAGKPMSFDVYNKDVFAIHFTTTTPGMVKLSNIDSKGTTELDIYTVKPGQTNRLPRAGEGGFVVDDVLGTESMRVAFEPCLPETYMADLEVQTFIGKLQKCTQLLAGKGGAGSGAAGKSAAFEKSTARGVTLSQPRNENKVGLIGTDKNYVPGTIVVYDLLMNHYEKR